MNRLKALEERLDDLDLLPLQRQIARHLIAGRSTAEIAVLTGQPEARIRLSVARIFRSFIAGRHLTHRLLLCLCRGRALVPPECT